MNKDLKERKIGHMIVLMGLVILAIVGGVFAYWTQTSSIDNPFDTGRYGSTIREDFIPADGENWQPGVTVDKSVKAVNTGDTDLIVRVRLDEMWTYKDGSTPYKNSNAASPDGYDVYSASQADTTDGLTTADGSVVTKTFSSSANWIDGGDGWYYYKINLAGGATSDEWLQSVTLLVDTDMGKIVTKKYVSVSTDNDEDNWIWVEYIGQMPKYIDASGNPCNAQATDAQMVLHNKTEISYVTGQLGYSQSDYILTVTVQTVQATNEAVNAVFGGSPFVPPTGTSWVLK